MTASTFYRLLQYVGLTILVSIGLCLFAGCASSELQLSLSLYKGDPALGVDTSVDEITIAITRSLDTLEKAKLLHEDAIKRTDTAIKLYNAYAAIFIAVSKARKEPASDDEIKQQLSGLNEQKNKYVESLSPLVTKLRALITQLQTAVEKLNSSVQQLAVDSTNANTPAELGTSVLRLKMAFASIQALLTTLDFKPGEEFTETIASEAEAYKAWVDAAVKSRTMLDATKATNTLNALTNIVDITLPTAPPDLNAVQEAVDTSIESITISISALSKTGNQAANDVKTILAQTPFRSMQEFESLQDAADPRWRVVKDPRNESKWVEQKSQTYFYSEGKNSVVVVRDRPDDFRVQNGSNDPTALVRSQLEISRAVGSAALTISGAAMGAPNLAAIVPPGKPAGSRATDDGAADSEKQAADTARVAEEARLRKVLVDDLRSKLWRLDEELDSAADDHSKLEAVNLKLQALLDAAETQLPTPPPPTQPAPTS